MKNKNTAIRIGALLALLISAISSAGFGLYLGFLIDAISNGNEEIFLKRLISIVVILGVNGSSLLMGRWCIYKDACLKSRELKNNVFNSEILSSDRESPDIAKFSDKIELVFNDVFLSRWVIVDNFFVLLFSSMAIIYINWIMFIVAILASFAPLIIPRVFQIMVQKATKAYTDESSQYLKFVSDTLQGKKEIKRYEVVDQFKFNHSAYNEKIEEKRLKKKMSIYKSHIAAEITGNSSFIIVFLVGGYLAFTGYMEVGGVIGVIQLMNNIVRPIIQISSLRNNINACKPVIKELSEEIEREKSFIRLHKKNESKIVLEAKSVSFTYGEEKHQIIDKLSYQYEKGKKYLIKGKSGVGKTTFGRILAGELKPSSGNVVLYSSNESVDEDFLDVVAYVDQKTYLFMDTIYNNIDLQRDIARDRIVTILSALDMEDIRENDVVDDNNGISGGQKARIGLARALVKLPKVLIVDEPTAALDEKSAKKVMDYLMSLPITVIVISHIQNENIMNKFDEIITF